MAIEFIGNKGQLLDFLYTNITNDSVVENSIIDLFSGTGSVGLKFKENGYEVVSNDFLYFCTLFAKKNLFLFEEPIFEGIQDNITHENYNFFNTPYDNVINFLNKLPPIKGFIYMNYSPASKNFSEFERKYFTEENAGKIDAIRHQIQLWKPFITEAEEALLITDLLIETVNVSNIAGTYGAYLKNWKSRSLKRMMLQKSFISNLGNIEHNFAVYNEDVKDLINNVQAPIIYADPPYTKRQYSAYYHILETIAVGDAPLIDGITGLRPWEEKTSDFCYKRKAPMALYNLVNKADCQKFCLSYNSDGQIPHSVIIEILSGFGNTNFYEQDYKRYKSNNGSIQKEQLKERLYILDKK